MANEMENNLGSVTALAELAKKIERQPGWRAQADPALVAEVYRRTARFDLVERWADGYLDPDAFLRAILAVDAADFGGDVVLAYIAKIDAETAEMNRALAPEPAKAQTIYIVRNYYADGDGDTQYRDVAFYADRGPAESKLAELRGDEDSWCWGYESYEIVEDKLILG